MREWEREESELSEVEDDEAAVFENGRVRGLSWVVSAGVEEPRGLDEGDGFEDGGAAEGDGGKRSAIPKRCSEVKEGIWTMVRIALLSIWRTAHLQYIFESRQRRPCVEAAAAFRPSKGPGPRRRLYSLHDRQRSKP